MSVYNFKVKDVDNNSVSLEDYKGKVLLIVNIATKCGLTPQLEGLEALYKKYQGQGFEILGFPCNQFLSQSPEDNAEIANFCSLNYGVTFKNFAKIDVNGKDADPLFVYLKEQKGDDKTNEASSGLLEKLAELAQIFKGSEINWNFTKFLIDRNGNVVERFSPTYSPEELGAEIEKLL